MLSRAPATVVIAAVTALVGVLLLLGDMVGYAAVYAGFIPARLGNTLPLLADADLMPVWLTPFTAALVHASFLHLGFNLVMLGYTGAAAERAIGARGIVVLYLLSAIGAALGQYLFEPVSAVPMIGASGAASGIIGAYSMLYSRGGRARPIGPLSRDAVQMLWLIVAWSAINLLVGFVTAGTSMPIAGAAHVGGFIVGVVLARPLVRWHWRSA
ncbi:rhomboid family intramembrane serine protease [Sphingomonas sp.]|uniref:rhomboid family intramembrane serine protease n=1 Tax=Sphingomonas sp. TaxID=28214 RepID=UPI002C556436|nr:rhomboid family intramembrane serine protease [Sphingomonas sp.]HTG38182.1 rhomboid family intramembrane serine protease [Sphingomonas sp.]